MRLPRAVLTLRSVKSSVCNDYAARAVLRLARPYANGRVFKVEDLAAPFGTLPNYLTQILIDPKSRQIVASVGEVIRAIHGQVFDLPARGDVACPPKLRAAWKHLPQTLDTAAAALTFKRRLEDGAVKDGRFDI